MPGWSFLTNHARVLVCIARDPGIRLHELAAILGVTERRAFGIVTDLSDAGYVVKEKDGRRNRYRIQRHLPLRVSVGREPTIGEVLELLLDTGTTESVTQHARAAASDPGLQPVAADALSSWMRSPSLVIATATRLRKSPTTAAVPQLTGSRRNGKKSRESRPEGGRLSPQISPDPSAGRGRAGR